MSLFVNPIPGSSRPTASVTVTSTTNPGTLYGIVLRQGEITSSPTLELDDVRVGSTWESVTPSSSQITVTVPDAPTIGTAVLGSNSDEVNVYFTAPTNTGGAPIDNYTVTSSNGTAQIATVSPYKFTGLPPGTLVTFTVKANNSAGSSAASGVSTSVTPATNPGAPTGVTAVRGNGEAIVSFTAPGSNGGATITEYTVTSNPGGITKSGSASSLTVTGLTNGTPYTFTVVAKNAALFSSVPSGSSTSVIPLTASAASLKTLKGISDANISAIMTTLLAAPIVNGSVVDIVALGMPHPNTGVDLDERVVGQLKCLLNCLL
jgi:hypothetical protein